MLSFVEKLYSLIDYTGINLTFDILIVSYRLFRLQEGLKERELCVFFRNNHFCTMFKVWFSLIDRHFHFYDCNILIFQFNTLRVAVIFQYEGELYLLATDQGYLNQPDLVWEKLNEVSAYSSFVLLSYLATLKEIYIITISSLFPAMASCEL